MRGEKVEGAKGVMVPDMRAQRENKTRIKVTPPSALSPASAEICEMGVMVPDMRAQRENN